jgi:hypothetical protein
MNFPPLENEVCDHIESLLTSYWSGPRATGRLPWPEQPYRTVRGPCAVAEFASHSQTEIRPPVFDRTAAQKVLVVPPSRILPSDRVFLNVRPGMSSNAVVAGLRITTMKRISR